MRNYIIAQGGTFLFNTKFIDLETTNSSVSKVIVTHLDTDATEKSMQMLLSLQLVIVQEIHLKKFMRKVFC